jgi:hypothetical protein
MSNPTFGVRTPAHFGSQSFGEAVACANFKEPAFYDKHLTALYNQLHLVQGNYTQVGIMPHEGALASIDLTERIEFLAKNAEPMPVDEFAEVLSKHLLSVTYLIILALYEPTKQVGLQLHKAVTRSDFEVSKVDAMREAYTLVNSLFNDKVKQWNVITKGMDKLNAKIHGEMKNAPIMEKAVERLEEATRKNKDKDILAANRAIERANVAWESIAKLNALFDIEVAKLEVIKEEMIPLRLLEDATRSLRVLAEGNLSSVETINVVIKAIGASLRCFPALFTSELIFADKLLRPDSIDKQFRRSVSIAEQFPR